jgi:uncharacterized protein YwqG
MLHIVQINFSELPEIKEFPSQSVLQIFSSLDFDDTVMGKEHIIRWDPSPSSETLLNAPEDLEKSATKYSKILDKALNAGLPLTFERHETKANPFNWPYEERNPVYQNRLPENAKVKALLEDWETKTDEIRESYDIDWVGGHPDFVQEDERIGGAEFRHLNRVIFHLGHNKDVNIGDSGKINVMINSEDLTKKNFTKAHLLWDCH